MPRRRNRAKCLLLSPPEEMEADTHQSFIPQEGKEGQEFYKYERLIIQMIVRYGEKVMCNLTDEEGNEVPVTVVEYVINDLKEDELAFHNPLHRRILLGGLRTYPRSGVRFRTLLRGAPRSENQYDSHRTGE